MSADAQKPKVNPRIIDVHSHYLPKSYMDAMRRSGAMFVDGFPMPKEWTVDKHLAVMEENKIASCVLSVSSPGLRFWRGDEAVGLSKAVNETGAEIIAANPHRFGVDALLPMPDVDASLREIEYALDALKLDGVGLYTNYDGVYLGATKFRPVLEELNRRKATVFVHPVEPPNFDQIGLGFPAPMLEYPFETTRMVTSLLRGGVLKQLPDIRFITTHGGGAVPFLGSQRMAFMIPMQLNMEAQKASRLPSLTPRDVAAQLAMLYFDVTAATIPPYLLALQNLAPTSRVLTGFDFPFMPMQSIPLAIAGLQTYENYTEADRAAIFSENALSLYPRLAPAS